jgi:hypothetical protein
MPVLDLTTKQHKYKVAVANAAGNTTDNIDILAITEGRRRAERVKVETRVRLCVCDVKTPVCADAEARSRARRSARVTPLASTR